MSGDSDDPFVQSFKIQMTAFLTVCFLFLIVVLTVIFYFMIGYLKKRKKQVL